MKIILGLIGLLLIATIGFAIFLGVYGGRDTVKYDEEVAIVLGAEIFCSHDGDAQPSVVLQQRLEKAVEYHKKNPTAKIIVSGGNEKDVCDTEAAVMKKYLIEHNVPEDVVLVEDHATSTTENFELSRKIMQEQGLTRAVIITSRSHMFRAANTAQRVGISARHLAAAEPWYLWPLTYGYEVPRNLLYLINPPAAVEVE
jgi:uncharacterized SAM-binding protein YcdF (DUF218 family)